MCEAYVVFLCEHRLIVALLHNGLIRVIIHHLLFVELVEALDVFMGWQVLPVRAFGSGLVAAGHRQKANVLMHTFQKSASDLSKRRIPTPLVWDRCTSGRVLLPHHITHLSVCDAIHGNKPF